MAHSPAGKAGAGSHGPAVHDHPDAPGGKGGKRRAPLSGGRWVTIHDADGGYHHAYIKGGKVAAGLGVGHGAGSHGTAAAGLKPSTRAMLDARKPVNSGGQRRDGLTASRTVNAMKREPMHNTRHGYEIAHHTQHQARRLSAKRSKRAAELRAERARPSAPAKPSLREQAAAHRAGKGVPDRAKAASNAVKIRASINASRGRRHAEAAKAKAHGELRQQAVAAHERLQTRPEFAARAKRLELTGKRYERIGKYRDNVTTEKARLENEYRRRRDDMEYDDKAAKAAIDRLESRRGKAAGAMVRSNEIHRKVTGRLNDAVRKEMASPTAAPAVKAVQAAPKPAAAPAPKVDPVPTPAPKSAQSSAPKPTGRLDRLNAGQREGRSQVAREVQQYRKDRNRAREAAAKFQGRAKDERGLVIPREGEKVIRPGRGMFGTEAYEYGTAVVSRSGKVQVRSEGVMAAMGGGAHTKRAEDFSRGWRVAGDPAVGGPQIERARKSIRDRLESQRHGIEVNRRGSQIRTDMAKDARADRLKNRAEKAQFERRVRYGLHTAEGDIHPNLMRAMKTRNIGLKQAEVEALKSVRDQARSARAARRKSR